MTSFRANPLTGDTVLFAPGRAERPRAFGEESEARCPFCAGHESDTPPAVAQVGSPWRVRVFPNKYPPVDGAEVIVESPTHGHAFDAIAHAEEVVRTYVERYRAHAEAAYICVFKNEGTRAGASIPHVHSQVMPLPFLPPRVRRELAGFAGACPLCAPAGEIIRETRSYVWLAPHGSAFAYQSWIVPKRHVAEMSAVPRLDELAELLRDASHAMRALGSYNWAFVNFPRHAEAHAYVDLHPRLSAIAGLELGTGTFVEIIDPGAAALFLREHLRDTR